MNIDYLSADGHKWLLGPEGAGIFYCRRELIDRTRPLMLGWMNVVDAQSFGTYNYTLRPDAGRFECGSYNVPGLLALKVSLEMLLDLGTDQVANRLHALGERLIKALTAKGYSIVSPRGVGQWSGIVSFTSASQDHLLIWKKLRKEHRIEIALDRQIDDRLRVRVGLEDLRWIRVFREPSANPIDAAPHFVERLRHVGAPGEVQPHLAPAFLRR